MGVADVNKQGTGVSMGAVWGDYDNDGYEDLFLIKFGKPELFHNDHGRGFTRDTEDGWIAALDQRQHRGLARLRWRRAARPVHVGGYYPEKLRPLALSQHARYAREF